MEGKERIGVRSPSPPGRHGLVDRMVVVKEPDAAFRFLAEKLLIYLL